MKEFLEEQGFKSLLNRMTGGGGEQQTGAETVTINDVMAAMEPKKPPVAEPEKIQCRPVAI